MLPLGGVNILPRNVKAPALTWTHLAGLLPG